MKKILIGLLLFGSIAAANSQILLREAKVDYKSQSLQLNPATNALVIAIPEIKENEFSYDPLLFIKNNFDAKKLVAENGHKEFRSYEVNFKLDKGFLRARYNKDGDLVSSFQKFRNVMLPLAVRSQIYRKYASADVLKTKYVAYSRGWDITKATYSVKISDGDKIHRLKIKTNQDQIGYTEN